MLLGVEYAEILSASPLCTVLCVPNFENCEKAKRKLANNANVAKKEKRK